MAPASPLADAHITGSTSSHDERTRRNVACVNCRNSKVRCETSNIIGQSCQRCAKLQLSCVVDRAHKRVTKRSKLEQLEQEVRAIQQAVQPNSKAVEPSLQAAFSAAPEAPSLIAVTTSLADLPPTTLHAPVIPLQIRPKTGPTQGRTLDEHTITGVDIDYYFAMFLQHFHPFLPLLRKRDPDECFQTQPMLFWVILYVACRRYARNGELFHLLLGHVSKNLWAMLSIPALGLEEIHALLFVCAWPFPDARFATDPSPMLVNIAMNAAMLLGLHTGRGSNQQFCVGLRNSLTSTDEEASATWAACCILAQRASTYVGHPPPSLQYPDSLCKQHLESTQWTDLLTMYEFQKFLNRFHTAISAQVSVTNSISDHLLSMWELELDVLKPSIIQCDTELSRFVSLASTLEIQLYHFQGQPLSSPALPLHPLKAFHTSRSLVHAATALQSRANFVLHAPHSILRSLLDAAYLLIYILHSLWCPASVSPSDAHALVQQACEALKRCSVIDVDVSYRAHLVAETFWRHRGLIPRFDRLPPAWLQRGGAGVTYACAERFKGSMMAVQGGGEGIRKALRIMHPSRLDPATSGQVQDHATDAFQDVDWNMLMDDFEWMKDDVNMDLL